MSQNSLVPIIGKQCADDPLEKSIVVRQGEIKAMPDLMLAAEFLQSLDSDPGNWTFQTFSDLQKDYALTRQFHGSLAQHQSKLVDLNERGAGIFVTVNKTNGKGRKKEDIRSIRALFVDLDGAPLDPVKQAEPAPHIIVQTSPGRYHAYWRVSDCPLEHAEPALKALIGRFDADTACSDMSRVMRLPGFYHCKAERHLVKTLEINEGSCLVENFGFDLQREQKEQKDQKKQRLLKSSSDSSVPSVGDLIRNFLPSEIGQRNLQLFELARRLKGMMPLATDNELRTILMDWHELALPVLGTTDFAVTWGDFMRGWKSVRSPHGATLNKILEEMDINEPVPHRLVELGYGPQAIELSRICKKLQEKAGTQPFFISVRVAGELLKMHFTDASKCLNAMVVDSVLELIERGKGKTASRYRYICPKDVA